ncbi:unnamed protein product, partial [Brenthis ino]
MGGGDLNTKKTWHPSTFKNQERVWKAEQAAAEEKKRILELERERAQERDREELNELSKPKSKDDRLHWMYDKPDKKVQQEDYLLGKAIDKNYDQSSKIENDIPAVSRRVVGSSMLTSAGDVQVDLARKLREDPLLMVKERERAARAALLNNPVQRRRLTELLRKEQEQKNAQKSEKKSKKKGKDIDDLLAAKLNALGGEKGMNIAKLLESDDSSSDSSSDEKSKKEKKKKKKKKQKSKKSKHDSDSDSPHKKKKSKQKKKNLKESSESEYEEKRVSKVKHVDSSKKTSPLKRKSTNDSSDYGASPHKRSRKDPSPYRKRSERKNKDDIRDETRDRKYVREQSYEKRRGEEKKDSWVQGNKSSKGLSEEEKAAKLAEMVAAGAEREVQRGKRVAEQRSENTSEKILPRFQSSRNEARTLPDSLESRIHSNRHYIQRGQRHMNEHFARR